MLDALCSLTHQEEQQLALLLKHRSPSEFSVAQLSRKAHWRWNRRQHREAAILFLAAGMRAKADITEGARDLTMSYVARAAINFQQAGWSERAWPLLERVICYDWAAAGNSMDDHMTEWCFVAMMQTHAAQGDRLAFAATFERALLRHADLGIRFPRIHPKQELLLELTAELGLVQEFECVVAHVESLRGPRLPRRLARKIAELRKRLSLAGP